MSSKKNNSKNVTLHIKHMVCPRCISTVENELKNLGLKVEEVTLGKAVYRESDKIKTEAISVVLSKQGFELIIDPEEKIVDLIKVAIIELIHYTQENKAIKNKLTHSKYIAEKLDKPYRYLSKIFSKHKEMTIEKYIILQRIEKAKELIEYGDMSFSEIAYKLDYKSQQHLSNQFKEVVGISMGDYKNKQDKTRNTLDKI